MIVDDHPLVRRGLIALINNEPDLTVCAEASSRKEGLEAIATARPDLVVVDLSLGDDDGLALLKAIRSSSEHLPVLVLSMHDKPIWAQRAFQAGANGYASKKDAGDTLLVAIRCVLDGGRYLSPKVSPRFGTS